MTQTDKKVTLQDLRQEIDQIDNQIHDLIIQRTQVVEQVRKVKKGFVFRPQREIDILKRLRSRHHGNLPFVNIYLLWRHIISMTLCFEGKFALALREQDRHLTQTLYRHFSSLLPYHFVKDSATLIAHIKDNPEHAACIPDQSSDPEVWQNFTDQNNYKITMQLPEAPEFKDDPAVFVISHIADAEN